MTALTDAEVQRQLDHALPHTVGCVAHDGRCICFHDGALERLLPVVREMLDGTRKRALQDGATSVQRADWGVDPDPKVEAQYRRDIADINHAEGRCTLAARRGTAETGDDDE